MDMIYFYKVLFLFFWLFWTTAAIFAQDNQGTQSQFFDAKYKMVKNSMVYTKDASYLMTKDQPVAITSIINDSIFFTIKNKEAAGNDKNSKFDTLSVPAPTMFFLTSDGSDKLKFTDFDISPLVIPLKIRPVTDLNPLQFSGDVSIGPYFGYQWGTKSFSAQAPPTQTTLTVCLFGSPSLVNLNPTNVSNDTSDANNVLGISVGAGILVDINHYQFGVVAGFDWISGTPSLNWDYQGKPWYSFSFAYNLTNK